MFSHHEVNAPFRLNPASDVDKLVQKLQGIKSRIVLRNLIGVTKDSLRSTQEVTQSLADYINSAGSTFVLDSVTLSVPVLGASLRQKRPPRGKVETVLQHAY